MGARNNSANFAENPGFQRRLAHELLVFLVDLYQGLMAQTQDVNSAAYVFPDDDPDNLSLLPAFDDIAHCTQTLKVLEITLLVELVDERLLNIPITIGWGGYKISDEYPGKPANPGTNLYKFIREYAVPVHDSQIEKNLVLMDSNNHHMFLTTAPHHKHGYRNGVKNKDAEPFSGTLIQFINEISCLNKRAS